MKDASNIEVDHGTFVRDGHVYPVGFFGGGLIDAAACDARASKEARAIQREWVAGQIVGFAGMVITATSAVEAYGEQWRSPGADVALGLGIAAAVAGYTLLVNARSQQYNVVSIYNMDMPQRCAQ